MSATTPEAIGGARAAAPISSWRPAPLLGPARGASASWRLALIVLGAMAVTLGAALLLALGPVRASLAARLAGDATVVISARPAALESADAAAARAAERLAALPAVRSSRVLDPAPADAAVARLVAAPPTAETRLVQVETTGDIGALAAALRAEGVAFAVVAHPRGAGLTNAVGRIGREQSLAGIALAAAGLALVLIGGVFSGAGQIGARAGRIALLGDLGASWSRLFVHAALPLAALTTLAAALGVGAGALALARASGGAWLLAPPQEAQIRIAAVAALPVLILAAGVAALAAAGLRLQRQLRR